MANDSNHPCACASPWGFDHTADPPRAVCRRCGHSWALTRQSIIPQDDATRKQAPMCRAALDYFPAALFAVAQHSYRSDRKHNPGKPEDADPTWARGKSTDHFDCIVRHLAERTSDPAYHLRALAWRALAALQEYCEQNEGSAPGAASRFGGAK